MTSTVFHFQYDRFFMLAFALFSVAIEKRTTSLTKSNVIALKKRSNTEKKGQRRKVMYSCVCNVNTVT